MPNITFETVTDGNIEQCRDLCNELMAFQKSKAVLFPEQFNNMNYETRLKNSYDSSPVNHVIVAKAENIPIGYVFSTIESVSEGDKSAVPNWAPVKDGGVKGFYPDWENFPQKVGCLNHLYVRGQHRAFGVGATLFERAMQWLESFEDVDVTFVYISNGNDAALDFYYRHGFTYSHDVFGGFITAAYRFKSAT